MNSFDVFIFFYYYYFFYFIYFVIKGFTVVKTTFDFNFDFYHANTNCYDRHKTGNKEKLLINIFSLFTVKLVI